MDAYKHGWMSTNNWRRVSGYEHTYAHTDTQHSHVDIEINADNGKWMGGDEDSPTQPQWWDAFKTQRKMNAYKHGWMEANNCKMISG